MAENDTIYIVDDDDGVRDAIRAPLEFEGFDVAAFALGVDFLRDAPPDSPCCLVLDVHMPSLGGFELLERIRSSRMGVLQS
jgi:two-component system response regulator FixJ